MDALEILARAPRGSELLKAAQAAAFKSNLVVPPKAAIIDPLASLSYLGTREKPSSIPLSMLRSMTKVPAIAAIIRTRQNQVARFAKPPRFEGDTGFKVVMKDIEAKMSPAEKEQAKAIQEFIMNTGAIKNRKRRDNFDRFLRKVVRDSLSLDQLCWENVYDRKNDLAEVWALDAATIELVVQEPVSEMYELPVYVPATKAGQGIEGEIAYVQRVQGQIVAEYTEDDMCFAVRNPYTDIAYAPFGRGELEDLYEIVTAIVNGIRYNSTYFTESHLPQGVLELIGKYQDEHLEAFKRYWEAMTAGPSGKWKVPVMALEDGQGFKFTPFKSPNKDMEYSLFMEFLFNIACAVWQIDPNEVGFKSWSARQGGLSNSDNTEAKIEQSKDKGFLPLMSFLSNTITSEIIDRINPDFCLTWIGVDTEAEQRKLDRAKARMEAGLSTTNRELARLDEEPIAAEWADAPANSVLIQVYMADKNAEMQQKQIEAQGNQQIDLEDKKHANTKELTGMQQQHELGKMDKEHQFQGNEGAMGRFHEEQMADKQHEQQKELVGVQHGQNKDLSTHEHGQNKELAEQQHGHQKELAEQQHGHQKELAGVQQKHELGKMDKQHGQNKELAEQGHGQKKELAEQAHGQKKELAEQAHDHQKELTADQQGHERNMASEEHAQQRGMAEEQRTHERGMKTDDRDHDRRMAMENHERTKETEANKHTNNKDLAEQKHGHAKALAEQGHEQQKDLVDHQSAREREGKRQQELFERKLSESPAKRRLQKSIASIYIADNPLIERLASRVHEAWMRTAGNSDDPDMKPYEELHEAVKETDRACARAIVEQLVAEGIVPNETKLSKAIDTAKFEKTPEGKVIEIDPWTIFEE